MKMQNKCENIEKEKLSIGQSTQCFWLSTWKAFYSMATNTLYQFEPARYLVWMCLLGSPILNQMSDYQVLVKEILASVSFEYSVGHFAIRRQTKYSILIRTGKIFGGFYMNV